MPAAAAAGAVAEATVIPLVVTGPSARLTANAISSGGRGRRRHLPPMDHRCCLFVCLSFCLKRNNCDARIVAEPTGVNRRTTTILKASLSQSDLSDGR